MSDCPTWSPPQAPEHAPALPYADYWFWMLDKTTSTEATATSKSAKLAHLAEEIESLQTELEQTYFADQGPEPGSTE